MANKAISGKTHTAKYMFGYKKDKPMTSRNFRRLLKKNIEQLQQVKKDSLCLASNLESN